MFLTMFVLKHNHSIIYENHYKKKKKQRGYDNLNDWKERKKNIDKKVCVGTKIIELKKILRSDIVFKFDRVFSENDIPP